MNRSILFARWRQRKWPHGSLGGWVRTNVSATGRHLERLRRFQGLVGSGVAIGWAEWAKSGGYRVQGPPSEGTEWGERARLGYLSTGPKFLVTPLPDTQNTRRLSQAAHTRCMRCGLKIEGKSKLQTENGNLSSRGVEFGLVDELGEGGEERQH